MIAPVLTADSTQTTITLTWTSAAGGVPPYLYSVIDQTGADIGDTTDLTATITGLTLGTAYPYTLLTTDSACRHVATAPLTS